MDGKLKIDEFITHRETLAGINKAFADMKAGECIRCVVDMRKL
jgi:S-(hydroxymethyl)glutathione dehydrogenase/alcohol dehydrogenase